MAYERALSLDPEFVEAYNNLGQVYKQRGDWNAAVRQYKKAIAVKPMFQNAYFNMAMIYKMSGELEEEAEVLQDIIDLFGSEDRQGSYAKNRLAELITSTSQSSMTSDIWDK